jgi:hypothetical protein
MSNFIRKVVGGVRKNRPTENYFLYALLSSLEEKKLLDKGECSNHRPRTEWPEEQTKHECDDPQRKKKMRGMMLIDDPLTFLNMKFYHSR